MADSIFKHHVLVLDDSPIQMQALQNHLSNGATRLLFADTLEALRSELAKLVNEGHQLDIFVAGADIGVELISSALHSLREISPGYIWINIVSESMLHQQRSQQVLERLKLRPSCTLLNSDSSAILQSVSRLLEQCNHTHSNQQLTERLEDIEARYDRLLDTSKEAIAFVLSGLHIYANPAYLSLVDCKDLRALSEYSILELLDVDEQQTPLKKMLREIEQRKQNVLDFEAHINALDSSSSQPIAAAVTMQPAKFNQEDCVQITLRKHIELATQPETTRHSVSRFLPRSDFIMQAEQRLQTISDEPAVAMVCISLDQFRVIQDNIGVVESDELLAERASLLEKCLDENTDLVTQYTEHAFVALVSRPQRSVIEQLVEHIVETFSNEVADLDNSQLSVTCSVGYSLAGQQNNAAEDLVSQAVRSTREATEAGGNQSKRFRPALMPVDSGDDRNQWQERLRLAIDNHELKLQAVVISDVSNDANQILDLQLCLHDADGERIIRQSEFNDAIAGSSLQAELDRSAIRLLLEHMRQEQGDVMLGIAPHVHETRAFAEWIQASLKYTDSDGDGIILCADSRHLQRNMQPMTALVKALQPTKIRWAVDNLGNSDNCEQLIQHLQPDYVRLHPDCSQQVISSTDNKHFNALHKTCRKQNTQIIAPGVESAAGVPALWRHGITLIQGRFLKQQERLIG